MIEKDALLERVARRMAQASGERLMGCEFTPVFTRGGHVSITSYVERYWRDLLLEAEVAADEVLAAVIAELGGKHGERGREHASQKPSMAMVLAGMRRMYDLGMSGIDYTAAHEVFLAMMRAAAPEPEEAALERGKGR